MKNKEEIEKAKARLKEEIEDCKNVKELFGISDAMDERILNDDAIETLLQYQEQLEQENKTLAQTNKSYKGIINKQNKIIDEMVEFIVSSAIADDTVCSRIFCDKEGNCSYKKQKKCTKQYFEKKVEEN